MVADSIPLARVQARDGYLESRWIDSASWARATRRRPLGTSVVRCAWPIRGRPATRADRGDNASADGGPPTPGAS